MRCEMFWFSISRIHPQIVPRAALNTLIYALLLWKKWKNPKLFIMFFIYFLTDYTIIMMSFDEFIMLALWHPGENMTHLDSHCSAGCTITQHPDTAAWKSVQNILFGGV